MKAAVSYIYFDIGNVLFDINHEEPWKQTLFKTDLNEEEAMRRFYSWGQPILHMIGQISDAEFFNEMCLLLEYRGGRTELEQIWKKAFRPNLRRLAEASQLSQLLPVGLLSNISPCHSKEVESVLNNSINFHSKVYSWEVGYVKPRIEIFQTACEKAKVPPEKILFIDDHAGHCEAARKLGFNSLHLGKDASLLASVKQSILNFKQIS